MPKKNWIKGAIKHPGALHEDLGVPKGQNIPSGKLAQAENSSNPTIKKRVQLAQTLNSMHHKPDPIELNHPDKPKKKKGK